MDALTLLKNLVSIPSESGSEDDVVDHLQEVFGGLGWSPVRDGKNIYALLGQGENLLLLNSHTDTVPVGEGWTKPALGRIENGRFYGRGSNDAKGCLTAMIMGAARAYAKNPPKGRVLLAATCEEETSGDGLEKLLPKLPKCNAAMIGEPTGLEPAIAQKGLLLLTVTAKGRSAHAAWGGGVNAIYSAAKDILALSKVAFKREHPTLGRPSLQVTQVSGGARHNVIPDRCQLVIDVRTTPAYAPEEIVELVRKNVAGEVEVRSKRLVSVDTHPSERIVQAALAARPGAKPFGSPTVSDWVFLKGIPTVKVGPGDSRRSHTPDEYLALSELSQGVLFYEKIIRAYHANAGT